MPETLQVAEVGLEQMGVRAVGPEGAELTGLWDWGGGV